MRTYEKKALLKPYSGLPPYPDEAGAGPGLSSGRLLSRASPHAVDRDGYRHWGWGLTGRGRPPPLSRVKIRISQAPPRPRFALLPRPGGGGSHGDTRWKAVPRSEAIWNKQVGFNKAEKKRSPTGRSVPEVAHARKDHRYIEPVCRIDDLLIPDRAARLDERRRPRRCRDLQGVRERQESV